MLFINSSLITQQLHADEALLQRGLLQPACKSFFLPSPHAPQGVVLLLHGFSAGTWQMQPVAHMLQQANMHCFAPRLPGHGACHADGTEDASDLPNISTRTRYHDFMQQAYASAQQLAQQHNVPLRVVGLSTGATLALDMALLHPRHIRQCVFIAPLLLPYGKRIQILSLLLEQAAPLVGAWLDKTHWSWSTGQAPAGRPGHWHFYMGNLIAALGYTRSVFKNNTALQVSGQWILTESDTKCDIHAALIKKDNATQQQHAWIFNKDQHVPHAMLTAAENNNTKSRDTIYKIIKDFFIHNQGSNLRQ